MPKRANSEGSIYKRSSDGRYAASLTWTDPVTGLRRRSTFYGRSRAEVRDKLDEAMTRRRADQPVRDATLTLGSWAQVWMGSALAASPRKPTTKELYVNLISKHILPAPIARRRLDLLRPSHVEEFLVGLTRQPLGPRGELARPALAPATIQRIFYVLRLVLDGAVRDGLLARNPAAVLKPPATTRHDARFLTGGEVAALLGAARGTRAAHLLTFIAATGVRKGEALALSWGDIDREVGVVRIRATLSRVGGELLVTTPKTPASRRVLPLTPGLAAVLGAQRRSQDHDRAHAQSLWQETDLVFTTETGSPMDPRNVLRAVTTAAAKAGLTRVTVHTLRHSAATTMLEAGVHLKAVSELLGHSDIRITGNVYGHVSTDIAKAAMNSLSDSLGL